MKNIILIGMPGSGKSTIGVLLAKTLGMPFVDTDLYIQTKEKKLLQNIINDNGLDYFLRKEEEILLNIKEESSIIATGGSAIYSKKGMEYLKTKGIVLYLKLDFNVIEKRINNISTRGIAIDDNKTLADLYNERIPLYNKYADIIVDCNNENIELNIKLILNMINSYIV